MFRFNPNDLKRMMRRMGIKVEVEEIEDADRVVIERTGDFNTIIENPAVTIMRMKGQSIVYITGELMETEKHVEKPSVEIPDEDIQLVAAEAGVSLDDARVALEATKGDIAQAIMLLEAKKH